MLHGTCLHVKNDLLRPSPVAHNLPTWRCFCRGQGSIPGLGTPHAAGAATRIKTYIYISFVVYLKPRFNWAAISILLVKSGNSA